MELLANSCRASPLARGVLTQTPIFAHVRRSIIHHCHLRCLTHTASSGVVSGTKSSNRKKEAVNFKPFAAQAHWKTAMASFQRYTSKNSSQTNSTTAPAIQSQDLHAVVTLCAASDRYREAMDVIHRGHELGVRVPLASYSQVCCALARKGHIDRAFKLIEEVHGDPHYHRQMQVNFYDSLLSTLKIQHDWRNTHRLIQQMHQCQLKPPLRAFRILLLTSAKAKRKDMVNTTIDFIEKQFPLIQNDVATRTAICQALVEIDETKRVLEIYHQMDDTWLREHATTALYNNFLLAAFRNDKQGWKSAMAIVEEMKTSVHAPPDDFTYGTCFVELEKHNEWEQIVQLFNEIQERDVKVSVTKQYNHHTPLINALICSIVLKALHQLQEEDPSPSPNKTASVSARRRHRMKQDLHVVLKKLPALDISTHVGQTSRLIDTLDELRLFTHARKVFNRLVEQDLLTKNWLRCDGYEIDLHTFSRGVAKCAVVHAFDAIHRVHAQVNKAGDSSHSNIAQLDDIRIITGVGKRSKEFLQPVIRKEITQLLTTSCRPPLWPTTHPTNPGVLLIRQNAIKKWLKKGGVLRYF